MRADVLLALSLLAACSSGADPQLALPLGTYTVSAPVCVSTGKAPNYPSATQKAALYDFDGLSAHTLTLTTMIATETFTATGCQLVGAHPVFKNSGNDYAASRYGGFGFTPVGCDLTVVVGGASSSVGTNTTSQFQTSTDESEFIPYVVATGAGGYTLTSADDPNLDSVWASYGCAASDQIRLSLGSGG